MKQKDKQTIGQLEKKLKAEQEARTFVEKQLMEEKKRKKLEEATAARAVAFAAATRYCHPSSSLPHFLNLLVFSMQGLCGSRAVNNRESFIMTLLKICIDLLKG